jgi:hypothetical protein
VARSGVRIRANATSAFTARWRGAAVVVAAIALAVSGSAVALAVPPGGGGTGGDVGGGGSGGGGGTGVDCVGVATTSLSVSTATILYGQSVVVSWSVQVPSGCVVQRSVFGAGFSGTVDANGSRTVTPGALGFTSWRVHLSAAGGVSSDPATVSTTVLPVPGTPAVAAVRNAGGQLALMMADSASRLTVGVQRSPGNGYLVSQTGETMSTVAAEINTAGRIEYFGVNGYGQIFSSLQDSPGSAGRSAWTPMEGALRSIAAARNADGRLEIFGANVFGMIFHRAETSPASNSWSPWVQYGGALTEVAAETNADGRIEVFGVNAAGEIYHCWQTAPNASTWSDWSRLDGTLGSIAVARNRDGRLEIVGVNGTGLRGRVQSSPGATTWSAWTDVPGGHGGQVAAETNADGRIEMINIDSSGQQWHRSQLHPGEQAWTDWTPLAQAVVNPDPVLCTAYAVCRFGDVNGDGLQDAVGFTKSSEPEPARGDVWVSLDNADTGFQPQRKWSDSACLDGDTCDLADVDGDGRADAVVFARSAVAGDDGDVWVSRSTGDGFGPPQKWTDSFCGAGETCRAADVNADHRADVIAFAPSGPDRGHAWVALNNGTGLDPAQLWATNTGCVDDTMCEMVDFDNDGRADAIAKSPRDTGDGKVWVARSTGSGFATPTKESPPVADTFATNQHNYTCSFLAVRYGNEMGWWLFWDYLWDWTGIDYFKDRMDDHMKTSERIRLTGHEQGCW